MQVVLNVRLHDLLLGPVVTRNVVREPWEVPLQVVPLHIRAAKSDEHGRRGSREKARVCLEVAPAVPPVRAGAREDGPLTDDLWQEARIRL